MEDETAEGVSIVPFRQTGRQTMYYDSDSGHLRFSPSDLTVFLETEFASWMDRWHLEHRSGNPSIAGESGLPKGLELPSDVVCQPDEEDEQLQLIANKGLEHEAAFLEHLREEKFRIAEFDTKSAKLITTLEAMQEGNEFIFQARLEHENFGGFADFLALKSGESSLGSHHYEPWDTKLALSPKASYVIQLCAYAEMLEQMQGRRPDGFEVVLGSNERVRFSTDQFIHYYRVLKQSFLEFQQQFNGENLPDPGLSKDFGRWSQFAEQLLECSDHLSRVANITRSQIKKLEAVGITTLSDLAVTTIERIPKLSSAIFERLRTQAALQLQSRDVERPFFKLQSKEEDAPRRGLELLPPASAQDVFFDIEGFPLRDGGLEYLLGAVYLETGDAEFVDWWAHDDAQEKQSFESFVDWVYNRWRTDPTMHIYHYAPYEVTAMRKLMGGSVKTS